MNKNEKPVSLKIPGKAKVILNEYKKKRENNNGFIFPFLRDTDKLNAQDLFTKTRNATKLSNKFLKRIADICKIEKTYQTILLVIHLEILQEIKYTLSCFKNYIVIAI